MIIFCNAATDGCPVKILNAIKQALKGAEKTNPELSQKTVDKWLDGLDAVLAKVEGRTETQQETKTSYSLERIDSIEFVRAEPDLFMNEDGSMKSESEIFDSMVGKVFHFPDGDVEIVRTLPGKNMKDELFRRFPSQNNLRGVKKPSRLNAAVNRNIEELIENSNAVSLNDPDVGGRHAKQGIVSFDTRSVNFYDGYRAYAVEFSIGVLNDGRKVAYAKRDYTYNKALTEKIRANDAKKQTVEKAVRATGKETVAPDVQLSQLSSSEPNQLFANEDKIAQTEQTVNTPYALDSVGRELSEGQQEYFKDSVIRDEQGRLKVMYHGSKKGGGFTVFKDWQYFTDKKQYAERYSRRGDDSSMYAVYLDVKKPFDTRNAECAKLYAEMRQELGLSDLMEDGLPDWTAGYDIADYIDENDLDYDGIILNEGGDLVDGKPVSRGESVVVRHPSQVKNTDNLNPTSDPDIRYATDDLGLPNGHYDYSKSFAEQIDDFKAGKFPKRDTFILGGTPNIYQKIGLSALPMTMEQGHVSNALYGTRDADHSLGETLLKQLPDLIKDPIAIIASDTNKDTSVVAIVKGTVNGKQIVTPVRINGTGKAHGVSIDSNHVATAFGKGNAVTKLLTNAVNDEVNGKTAVYYWKKTEALSLAVESGLQLPGGHISDGLIHSIFDAGSPVNRKYLEQTETRQFKNWFGKSVVKNADGTPEKVYHGTAANFTVFERGDIGYHVGTKAQAEDRIAGVEGGHVMELYASIQNPLYAAMDFGDWHGQNVAEMLIETEQFEDFDNRAEIEERLSEVAKMDNQQEADTALRKYLQDLGYDGIVYENRWEGEGDSYIVFESSQLKSATDNIGLFDRNNPDIRYALDKDFLRDTVNAIDTEALEKGFASLSELRNVKFSALLDPSRLFDAVAGNNKELRNNLHEIFEKPHSDATGRYASNIQKMQARVEQIALDAGALTVNKKGKKTFHEDVSAAIQNYGEGYQMKDCIVNAWVASQDVVRENAI